MYWLTDLELLEHVSVSKYAAVGYPIYDCPSCQGSDVSEPRIFFFDSLDEIEGIIYGKGGPLNTMYELEVLYEDEKLVGKFEYDIGFHRIQAVSLYGLDDFNDADESNLIRKFKGEV